MTKPIVVEDMSGYTLAWEQEQVKITVTAVKSHSSDGRITGMVRVETTAPGTHKLLHSPSQFNFTATRSRSELARRLTERLNHVDWYSVLEQMANEITARATEGQPVLELVTGDEVRPPPWLLKPLLLEGLPTIVFGDRGSAKSTLAVAWAQVLQLPWPDNPFLLDAPEHPVSTLYLDWEVSEKVLLWQATKMQRGMLGKGVFSQNYRRMSRPLVADLEAVRRAIAQTRAEAIIIDSLGPASGGDLNTTNSALDFFSALSQLRVTSLILAHTAKNADSNKRSVFGSVFYENEARNIWEVKALQEPGDDTLEVGLFHRKPLPFYGKIKPFGYKLTFTDTTTVIKPQNPEGVGEFAPMLGSQRQIEQFLLDSTDGKTVEEIAKTLTLSEGAARQALKRLKDKERAACFRGEGRTFIWRAGSSSTPP